MVFRLFVNMPEQGWVLVCSVDAPDDAKARDEAMSMLKPEHIGKPMQLQPGHLPPPGKYPPVYGVDEHQDWPHPRQ